MLVKVEIIEAILQEIDFSSDGLRVEVHCLRKQL
jgi:hypothetical protein